MARMNRNRSKSFKSTFGEFIIRGSAKQIYEKWLGLANEVTEFEREGMLQQADHWKRVASPSL